MLALRTLPGQNLRGTADLYIVLERAGRWYLYADLGRRDFPTVAKLAHTLGGIVPWDRWSPEAQLALTHLGVRGVF